MASRGMDPIAMAAALAEASVLGIAGCAEAKETAAAKDALEARIASEKAALGDLVAATAGASTQWPPAAAIASLEKALDAAETLGLASDEVSDAREALVAAARIAVLAAEGEGVAPKRKAAARAADAWKIARKVEGLTAEGRARVEARVAGAAKLQASAAPARDGLGAADVFRPPDAFGLSTTTTRVSVAGTSRTSAAARRSATGATTRASSSGSSPTASWTSCRRAARACPGSWSRRTTSR